MDDTMLQLLIDWHKSKHGNQNDLLFIIIKHLLDVTKNQEKRIAELESNEK